MIQNIPEQVKVIGDGTSIGVVVATLAGWLPALAALMTVVWTAIRIWETDTVQKWRKKRPTPATQLSAPEKKP